MIQGPTFGQNQTQQIIKLFEQMIINGRFHRFWSRLIGRPSRLLDFDETVRHARVKNSHYAGIRSVNIDRIRGTQGKSDAFDSSFYPIKENSLNRWLRVAREKLNGHGLPPVELIDVDGTYYVRDGHHRISVARSFGQSCIDAEIIVMQLNRRIS